MPGSSGGSITLRLSLAGSDEVKAALASLGPAGARALREVEAAQAGPNAGFRALNAAGADLNATMRGLGGGLGALGNSLMAIGPAGLLAAAGIGAIVEAGKKLLEMSFQTAEWAEGVLKFAKATGQSTTAVQEFDFVAQASGIPVAQMRAGVEGIGKAVGQLQDNLARGKASPNTRVFEAILGTDSAAATGEKLRQLGDLQHILPVILDYASKLSATERLGLTRIFHVDPETLNSLIETRGQIGGLIEDAHRYGIVVDEDMIKKSAEAGEKMHVAAAIIQGEMRTALAGLAQPASDAALRLAKVALAIGDVARGAQEALSPIAHFIEALNHVPGAQPGHGPNWLQIARNVLSATPGGAVLSSVLLGAHGLAVAGADARMNADSDADLRSKLNAFWNQPAAGGVNLPPLAGGGGRRARTPKDQGNEIIDHVRQMIGQADTDVLNARKAELQAQLQATKDVDQRAAIQAQINAIEDQAKDDASLRREQANSQWLEELKAKKGVTAAELRTAEAGVKAANAAEEEARLRESGVASQRDLNALTEKRAAAEKQLADAQKASLQAQIDMLRAELPLVQTMQQRRDIELALFDLEEQQKEAELRATISSTTSTPDQIAGAKAQLGNLLATADLRRQGVSNANPTGPWSAEVQKLIKDTPTLTQEWQTLAADGVEKFNADLFDAQGRVQNLGQVFRSVVTDMLKMLEQYLLKQAEIGMFGGSQGGSQGDGLFNTILSFFGGGGGPSVQGINFSAASDAMNILPALPGLAGGGYVSGRGTGRSDSVLARLSAGERVMNFEASTKYGPMLDALNAGKRVNIAHFAGGGAVAGGQGGLPFVGDFHYHDNRDMSVHAPGADTAALNRVVEGQKAWAQGEPQRFVSYAQTTGLLARPRRR